MTYHAGEFHMLLNGFFNYPGVINIGYFSSPDGRTWTAVQDEPVLTSEEVPYAAPGILASSLQVLEDGTWVLYFSTINHSEPAVIGRATADSPLGPWAVDPQPILSPGPAGAWDDRNLVWPDIVKVEDGWVMFYAGGDLNRRGLAASPGGLHWTPYMANPIIARGDSPIRGSAWDTALVYQDGAYYYFMEIGTTSNGTDIYMATHECRLTK